MKVAKVLSTTAIALLFVVFSASAQEFSPVSTITLSTNAVGEVCEIFYMVEQDYGELDLDSVYTTISAGVMMYEQLSPQDICGDGIALMAGAGYTIAYDLVVFSVNPAEDRVSIQGVVTASTHPLLQVGDVMYHMDIEGNDTNILITEWTELDDGNNWTMGTMVETNYGGFFTLPAAAEIEFSIHCVSEPDDGGITYYGDETIALPLGIDDDPIVNPVSYALSQNYPNPFNSSTRISYDVSVAGHVMVNIYSIEGRLVRTLVNGNVNPGTHHVTWNGLNNTGSAVSTGVYLYNLQVADFQAVRKMVYLK